MFFASLYSKLFENSRFVVESKKVENAAVLTPLAADVSVRDQNGPEYKKNLKGFCLI